MMTIRKWAIKTFGRASDRTPDAQYVTAEVGSFSRMTMRGVYAHGEFYPFGDHYVGNNNEQIKRSCQNAAKNKDHYAYVSSRFEVTEVHYNHYL